MKVVVIFIGMISLQIQGTRMLLISYWNKIESLKPKSQAIEEGPIRLLSVLYHVGLLWLYVIGFEF